MMGVVFGGFLSSFAQSGVPVPAPADIMLEFRIEGDGHQFHLGESIPIKFSYSAKSPGRYIWVNESAKLAGGRPLEISCSPSAERVTASLRLSDDPSLDEMLNAPCGGVGGGIGGGLCSDCDWEQPLDAGGLKFGAIPLNMHIRFRTPGTYTCEASSADVTLTPREEKSRTALIVKSNPVVLTIVDDPAWSHSAASAYADAYENLCRGNNVAGSRLLQCFDLAHRITYLDTPDSLATEVKWFDGKDHSWENGFPEAIRQSSKPEEALRLMSSRMQEPGFQVSISILEWLATTELRIETPDAFQSGTPLTYHVRAVEKVRKYVRLLGNSLSAKDPDALAESTKTYLFFAEQKYCGVGSLIPNEEQNQILGALAIRR
jgi:hypothetical protein